MAGCSRDVGEFSRVEHERSCHRGARTRNPDEDKVIEFKIRFSSVFDQMAILLDTFQISAMRNSFGPTGARLTSTRPLAG